jgi:hypothetical protein
VEHLVYLATDQGCGEALVALMTTIVKGDVSKKVADLLSSTTLVIHLKKDVETMAAMKKALDAAYVQPQHPYLGVGSTLVNIASSFALIMVRGSLGAAVGPSQFSIETKDGCDQIQWALQMAMESNKSLVDACLNGINAFKGIERICISAALEANLSLHILIPVFEMLY